MRAMFGFEDCRNWRRFKRRMHYIRPSHCIFWRFSKKKEKDEFNFQIYDIIRINCSFRSFITETQRIKSVCPLCIAIFWCFMRPVHAVAYSNPATFVAPLPSTTRHHSMLASSEILPKNLNPLNRSNSNPTDQSPNVRINTKVIFSDIH